MQCKSVFTFHISQVGYLCWYYCSSFDVLQIFVKLSDILGLNLTHQQQA